MPELIIPAGCGLCPVCNGSGRRALFPTEVQYKKIMAGYDAATDTMPCNNCGGQTMFGRPLGYVPLNKDGQPCRHEYIGRNAGRCYTIYTCTKCSSHYDIDSGD
jgi:hypothetical protein